MGVLSPSTACPGVGTAAMWSLADLGVPRHGRQRNTEFPTLKT